MLAREKIEDGRAAVLLPRRAFEIRPDGRPAGLPNGRTGRLVLTTDSPWWYLRLMGDTAVKQLRAATLRYCGIRPVWTTRFGPVKGSSDAGRERWLDRTAELARRDAAKRRVRQAGRVRR
ncbi:hypothetical protein ACFWY9_07810 [Amycolatopsis sp. NPDC059027]|uniref:hypothetical protein n=1 Tax=unclassified Amycolatopsis TaxID=2618356 RepID=UPI00366BA47A